jgi:hypothetical protein
MASMSKTRHVSPGRQMKPMIMVFCEGATEDEYINFLRIRYHAPIKIISKITGQQLSQKLIDQHTNTEKLNGKDTIHTFLMYDLDSPSIADKVKKCQGEMICCNPCLELWFLLHAKEHRAHISTSDCLQSLMRLSKWGNYKKGFLSDSQKNCLWENRKEAVNRGKILVDYQNPSAPLHRFLDLLEENSGSC